MKNSQVLVIHSFPILFAILKEIKSILNFKIKQIEDHELINSSALDNLVIVSGKKGFKSQNLVAIDNYPINIQKLVEIINIQFLKNRFNKQNSIVIGRYIINLNSRTIKCGSNSLSLTEKETKIINYLNLSKKPVTISDLQFEVWGHKSKLETHTVETHVYRLRKKVEQKFKDKSFILSQKNGYKIKT